MPSHQERREPLPKDYQFGDAGLPMTHGQFGSIPTSCIVGHTCRVCGGHIDGEKHYPEWPACSCRYPDPNPIIRVGGCCGG
jgi:hypothetical protein